MSTKIFENIDCMKGMERYRELLQSRRTLAICDPPYGIHDKLMNGCGFMINSPQKLRYKKKQWDRKKPNKNYFIELFRVSQNQIIWGGNYYDLPPTRGIIAWVKPEMKNHPNFSQWEMAWSSFDKPAKVVYEHIAANKERTFHPTQKPVALYRWLLQNYGKDHDLILDTHVGSASSLIACEKEGFDYIGFELDKDYYRDSKARLERETKQVDMFQPVNGKLPSIEQESLF